MKELAVIEYTIIFEPGMDTWPNGYGFETDFSEFFATHNIDATFPVIYGGSIKRVIYLTPKDKLDKMRSEKPSRHEPGEILHKMAEKGTKKK